MNNRERRERTYNTKPALLLGFVMVLVGVAMVLIRVFEVDYGEDTYFIEDNDFGLVGRAILIVGGLAILFNRHRGNYFAVGVYALTLGLSRVIRSLPGLVAESDITFYMSLIFLVVGGNLAWGGYNHLTVKTRNPATMRYTALALLLLFSLVLGYLAYSDADVVAVLLSDINLFGYLPLYAGLLAVLYSKELLENIPLARVSRFLKDVSSNGYAGDYLAITEEDAKKIEEGFSDVSSWSDVHIGDIVVKEAYVKYHAHNGKKDVLLERWPDSDLLLISLINDRTDSFIGGQRIQAKSYVIEGDEMFIFDSQGICTVMRIRGDLK